MHRQGVIESAVVGARAAEGTESSDERVHAVLVLDPGVEPETVIRTANSQLADHQRIRSFSIWTDGPLPRTEGTKKLKRAAIKAWVGIRRVRQVHAGAQGADPVASAAREIRRRATARRRRHRSKDWD